MRDCMKCSTKLPGQKRHGFVTPDGKAVWCGDCTYPKKKKGKRRQ